ncbi:MULTISPECIES: hypothetical protein [Lactococcus]|jgi:hypothetical protein|uniref:hypothetical protein n=1 Tax=Lactococcus TaxID=1357 RepID=UPI001CDC70EC|nr:MULTISPECIES: hypothetical protein [Lactococcus]MCA2389045.1 hypothetical protein [Lactococcus sp. NH2-7C]MCI1071118.1 hypothetical protein [Lactococcus lactis]MCT1194539.1 hypothetical protein [Lactococcus lactis]WGV30594.1 hypothetical protein QJV49_01020 [Lactococcus sp. NH2-7C]
MKLILSSIFLGFGGFDPMGAVLIMAALANRTKKNQVYLFSLMALLSTVIFGLTLSYGTSLGLNYFTNIMNHIPDMAYVLTGFLISFVCVAWFIRSTFLKGNKERGDDKKESKFMKFAKRSMPLAGFIFGFWAMSDPTFWAVVALSAKEGNILLTILCLTIWMLLGQIPLYTLVVSLIFNVYEKWIKIVNRYLDKNNRRKKLSNATRIIILLFILGIGIYFFINSLVYLLKGIWIY